MSDKPVLVAYARGPETRNQPAPYHQKFAGFIKTIAQAKANGSNCSICIAQPWVIGDTHEEIVESLSRLAGTGVWLQIVHRDGAAVNN
jgi:hypothetical protein